jgi:hypothetical protein
MSVPRSLDHLFRLLVSNWTAFLAMCPGYYGAHMRYIVSLSALLLRWRSQRRS